MEKIKCKRIPILERLSFNTISGVKLNLGCGFNHFKGCINVDSNPDCFPDMCFNIEETWPIESKSVDYLVSVNTFEHIKNFYFVLGEAHRVCKTGALFELVVPNCWHASAFEDPTHVRFFGSSSWQYFSEKTYSGRANTSWYTSDRFNFSHKGTWGIISDNSNADCQLAYDIEKSMESDNVEDPVKKLLVNVFSTRSINLIRYLQFQFVAEPLFPIVKQPVVIKEFE